MIQLGTIVKVCDNTGVRFGRCIKVVGKSTKKEARVGDVILMVIKRVSYKIGMMRDARKRRRFGKGNIQRALVIRTCMPQFRGQGVFIRFVDNAVVLVDRKRRPIGRRLKGPVMLELARKYPGISAISKDIV